jgi:hypothetical protein
LFPESTKIAAIVLLIFERKKFSTVLEVPNELCPLPPPPPEITFLKSIKAIF